MSYNKVTRMKAVELKDYFKGTESYSVLKAFVKGILTNTYMEVTHCEDVASSRTILALFEMSGVM